MADKRLDKGEISLFKKGFNVAIVIMNSTDYDNKIADLLADVTIYEKLKRDPTSAINYYKNKLVNTTKEWKRTTILSALYYKTYYTSVRKIYQ